MLSHVLKQLQHLAIAAACDPAVTIYFIAGTPTALRSNLQKQPVGNLA